jgi:hypothetical protein
MLMRYNSEVGQQLSTRSARIALALLGCACTLTPQAFAAVSYDEAVSGDLSNSGLSPTVVSVSQGQTQVFGSTGRQSGVVDRDYFSFTIPAGQQLTSIVVLPGTTAANLSFLGMESGSQVTLPSNAASAAGLLGWTHYSPASGNVLPDMGVPAAGSAGFTPPLPAGTYSFWVQELSTGTYNYGFDFGLEPVPVSGVPDTGPGLLGCTAAGALLALGRLRIRKTA